MNSKTDSRKANYLANIAAVKMRMDQRKEREEKRKRELSI